MKPLFKRGLNRDDVAELLGVEPGMPDLHQRLSDLEHKYGYIAVVRLNDQKCHWPLRSGHLGQCYIVTKKGLRAYEHTVDLEGPGGVRVDDPESSEWAALADRSTGRFAVLDIFVHHTRPR